MLQCAPAPALGVLHLDYCCSQQVRRLHSTAQHSSTLAPFSRLLRKIDRYRLGGHKAHAQPGVQAAGQCCRSGYINIVWLIAIADCAHQIFSRCQRLCCRFLPNGCLVFAVDVFGEVVVYYCCTRHTHGGIAPPAC